MPRRISTCLNDSVTDTMRAALRYRNISSRSSMRMANDSFMAPTALMDSGHRSRSSNTYGMRFMRLTTYAATAVKNCGDVPMTRSTPRTRGLATIALAMKLR